MEISFQEPNLEALSGSEVQVWGSLASAQGLAAATRPMQRLVNTHSPPLPPLLPWRERGKRSDEWVHGVGTGKGDYKL